ncbi:hypothetical protein MKW98_019888, partial [Papaver atlanticum]
MSRRSSEYVIGVAPKDKIFKKYIEIELQLGDMDRCRTLYARTTTFGYATIVVEGLKQVG